MGKMIKIEELVPGMVIDKDVTNLQGAPLLKKGNEITEKHVKVFKTWGVKTVFIQEDIAADELDGRPAEEVAAAKITELEKQLDAKFADVIDSPAMQTIKTLAFARRRNSIKKKYNITDGE